MEATEFIRRDHRAVEHLFQRFERAERNGQLGEVRRTVREIIRELSIHASIEEQLVYPVLRDEGMRDEALQALEEHHAVKLTLSELDAMDATDERFAPKVRLVIQEVRQHVEEEEEELLPALDRALDRERLLELGQALARAKRLAPTRPHPAAPDTPPGNFVVGALAALVDRSRDAVRDGADTVRLVATRRGRKLVREVRERSLETIGETRAATADLLQRGGEVTERVRERGREAALRADEGARRLQQGVHAAAREVREDGRVRREDGRVREDGQAATQGRRRSSTRKRSGASSRRKRPGAAARRKRAGRR